MTQWPKYVKILKDIMIALMIAAAISLLMCYLPMIVDAATKKGASSGGEGTVTNVVNALSKEFMEKL